MVAVYWEFLAWPSGGMDDRGVVRQMLLARKEKCSLETGDEVGAPDGAGVLEKVLRILREFTSTLEGSRDWNDL